MSDWLRKYVLHNFGLKIVALLSAVALWLAVAREPMAEIGFTVPIEFQHVPDYMEINSETIPQAQIRVRGPQRVIRQVAASDVHPVIDLVGARVGERTYDLNAAEISVPRNVEVVQIIPSQFRMSLDRRESKQVGVQPRVIGTMAPGYRLAEVRSDPPDITIIGPESRVRTIDAATTDPVDATGVVGKLSVTMNAYVNDPLVRVVRPVQVRVTVTTEKISGAAGSQ